MARGKPLSEYEKGRMDTYKAEKLSIREISRRLKISLAIVQNYINNPAEYGKKKSNGRPKSLRDR